MSRGLIHSVLVAMLAATVMLHGRVQAADPDPAAPILQRFLALDASVPTHYRALRRLDARGGQTRTAWMDVWTETDRTNGFRYVVADEGGSDYIRSKVFRASLESEKKLYASGTAHRAALTPENYVFEETDAVDGLSTLAVTPRRKDVLLVDGSIFLKPDNGDLVRLEGRLSKAPSFWIRQVQIVRSYERIGGARVPVSLEAVANIWLAGKATFRMTYEYETINGRQVGTPRPRLQLAD